MANLKTLPPPTITDPAAVAAQAQAAAQPQPQFQQDAGAQAPDEAADHTIQANLDAALDGNPELQQNAERLRELDKEHSEEGGESASEGGGEGEEDQGYLFKDTAAKLIQNDDNILFAGPEILAGGMLDMLGHGLTILGRTTKAVARGAVTTGNEAMKDATAVMGAVAPYYLRANEPLYADSLQSKDQNLTREQALAAASAHTKDFMSWWANSSQDHSGGFRPDGSDGGFKFYASEPELNATFGGESEGAYGLVQGLSQFLTGMALVESGTGAAEALPGLGAYVTQGANLLNKSGFATNLIKGAIVDNAFFDVHMGRLSNLIQKSPLANPVTQYLAADPHDGAAKAHLKATLEGMLTEALVAPMFKLVEGMKEWHEAGGHTTEANRAEIESAFKDAQEAFNGQAENPEVEGVFKVRAATDGQGWEVYASDPGFLGKSPEQLHHPDARAASAPSGLRVLTQGEALDRAAALNLIAEHQNISAERLLPAQIQKMAEGMQAAGQQPDPRSASEILSVHGFNPRYVMAPDESVNLLKAITAEAPEPSTVTRGKPTSWAESQQRGRQLLAGMGGDQVLAMAQRLHLQMDDMPGFVDSLRTYQMGQLDYARKLWMLSERLPSDGFIAYHLQQAMTSAWELHAYTSGINSNLGRSLNILKKPVGQDAGQLADESLDALAKLHGNTPKATATAAMESIPTPGPHRAPITGGLYDGMTKQEIRSLNRFLFMGGPDADPMKTFEMMQSVKAVKDANGTKDPALKKSLMDYALTLRVESMLSGPKTHVTNFSNNLLVALQQPLEMFWAGAQSRNKALMQDGLQHYAGLWNGFQESWAGAKKAFFAGDSILDKNTKVIDPGTMAHNQILPWNDSTWWNKYGHLSSRLLLANDEMFKQLNYRANIRSQVMRQATEEGITDPVILNQRLEDGFKFAFNPDGGATNAAGLDYARYATFTTPLEGGQKWIMDGAQKYALGRVILPFVRTPTNLFNFAWERTPGLNLLMKSMREDLAAGGERMARAQAKTQFGATLWGTAAMLALSGKLTGRGPADPDLNKVWRANHEPYSLTLDDGTTISLKRMDPLGTPLSIAADLVSMSGEMKENEEFAPYVYSFMAAAAANVTNKNYMMGVANFLDALSSKDPRALQHLTQNTAASFEPNVLRQVNPDPYMHETRSILDEFASRTPGFSSQMEARRNILGEKMMMPPGWFNQMVNPFTTVDHSKVDQVQEELTRIGKGFPMPRDKRVGINLRDRDLYGMGKDGRQSPYDRMLEILSDPPNGVPSLREELSKIMSSPGYQKLPADDLRGPGGRRWMTIAGVINKRQEAAWQRVLIENPRLRAAYKQAIRTGKVDSALGQDAGQQFLQSMQTNY